MFVLKAVLVSAVLAGSAVAQSSSCFDELEKLCEAERKELGQCQACIASHKSELSGYHCTVTIEDDFCHPAPKPTEKCEDALELDCGKERRNHTECLRCTHEHDANLKEHNCSVTQVAAFCKVPVPPHRESCALALEHDCGEVRHNRTNCFKCIREHEPSLEKDNCTRTELADFCGGGNSSYSCREELEHYCGVDRSSEPKCATCTHDHAAVLEKAHCTSAEVHDFCTPPKPVPPSEECEHVLVEYCEADRRNRTLCTECVSRHHNQTRTAHCTYSQIEEFCHPVPPPAAECARVMVADCGADRSDRTKCRSCVAEHHAAFAAAKCTEAQEADFCEAPHPGPSPRPLDRCYPELEKLCENERANRTKCVRCIGEYKEKLEPYNCTYKDVDEFCHIEPVPSTCPEVLEKECGVDRSNRTLCTRCLSRHRNETAKVHCTREEEAQFCEGHGPKPSPSAECAHALTEYCEADRRNRTLCMRCVAAHHNETFRAHCTYEQEIDFCREPTPQPPTPGSECDTEMRTYCGISINEKDCLECAKKHESELKAKCSASEEISFCKSHSFFAARANPFAFM